MVVVWFFGCLNLISSDNYMFLSSKRQEKKVAAKLAKSSSSSSSQPQSVDELKSKFVAKKRKSPATDAGDDSAANYLMAPSSATSAKKSKA